MIERRTTSFVKQRRWSIATEAEVTSRPARVVDLPSLWIAGRPICGSEALAGLRGDTRREPRGDASERGQRAAQARLGTAIVLRRASARVVDHLGDRSRHDGPL
jgi:hypothetical protein